MTDGFIGEDDLLTFEGFLKYQAVDPAVLTPDDLAMWRSYFDEAMQLRETSPKVGLMKLRQVPGEQKGTVKLAESKLGMSRVARVNGRDDDDGSRPDLRQATGTLSFALQPRATMMELSPSCRRTKTHIAGEQRALLVGRHRHRPSSIADRDSDLVEVGFAMKPRIVRRSNL